MPRIAGVNPVAVLVAAIVMFFVGFIFYGLVFSELWQQQMLENHGLVPPGGGAALTGEALASAVAAIPGAMDMAPAMSFGFLISLVTSLGIALLLGLVKPATLGAAMRAALVAWVGFAATTLAYNVVYASQSRIIFGIDLAHLLVGYLAAAAIIFLIDGKAIRPAG